MWLMSLHSGNDCKTFKLFLESFKEIWREKVKLSEYFNWSQKFYNFCFENNAVVLSLFKNITYFFIFRKYLLNSKILCNLPWLLC